jgi:uncharacterized caspase-like protein
MSTMVKRRSRTPLKTGPKTILTDKVILQLQEQVLKGKDTREIAKILSLNEKTLYDWKYNNYRNLQDKWNTWELQRKLRLAEEFSERLLEYKAKRVSESGKEYIDSRLLAVQQREAEYLRTNLLIAKSKYDAKQSQVVNIVLPTPIMDIQTVVHEQTVENEKLTGEGMSG